jgi:hypothetical protein
VHIASFDDLIKNPDTSLAQLSTFLSIAPFPHVQQLQSNKTFGEPAGPLAARMSELIYTPNLTKTIVRSLLPWSLRKACSDSIKRAIPRRSYNGYISDQVLEQLENLFDRDDERVYSYWIETKGKPVSAVREGRDAEYRGQHRSGGL